MSTKPTQVKLDSFKPLKKRALQERRKGDRRRGDRRKHQDRRKNTATEGSRSFISILQGKVYQPLLDRIHRLSWWQATLLLAFVYVAPTAIKWIIQNPNQVHTAYHMINNGWAAHANRTSPLTKTSARSLSESLDDLKRFAATEYEPEKRGSADTKHEPWTVAQLSVALQGTAQEEDAIAWLEAEKKSGSWREYPQSSSPHIPASAWVLLAFASVRHQPSPESIKFLLDNQHVNGWWPVFPCKEDAPQNESTYATALATLALHDLLAKQLVPPGLKPNVQTAIENGRAWLESNRMSGRSAFWKEYPKDRGGRESWGVSGLALHTLFEVDGKLSSAVTDDWLSHLPSSVPGALDAGSNYGHPIRIETRFAINDTSKTYELPGLIIGTTDVFHNASWIQRTEAMTLMDRVLESRSQIRNDVSDSPWVAAEILISLRELNGEHAI